MPMQQLRLALLSLVVDTISVSHIPQLMSHVFGRADQCTSQVVWSCGSHVNISEIICGLK